MAVYQPDDPQLHRVLRNLDLIGVGPARMFADACRMYEQGDPFFSRSHLAAHMLREVESAVRSFLQPSSLTPEQKEELKDANKTRNTHRCEVKHALESIGFAGTPVADQWERIAASEDRAPLHKLAHRRNLLAPRDFGGREFQDSWREQVEVLDAVLQRVRLQYSAVYADINSIAAADSPTAADLKRMAERLPTSPTTLSYFFSKAPASTAWLSELSRAGLLEPTEPFDDGAETRHPAWPASHYLTRAASAAPEQVVELCLQQQDSKNRWVRGGVLDIAVALGAEDAAKLTDILVAWVSDASSNFLVSKLIALGRLLASEGQTDAAFLLLEACLAPVEEPTAGVPEQPRVVMEDYWAHGLLEAVRPHLLRVSPPRLLATLSATLARLVEQDLRHDPASTTPKEDYSSIWCRDTTNSSQTDDLRAIIASNVFLAAEHLAKIDADTVLKTLRENEWPVFARIELEFLARDASSFGPIVRERLLDRSLFENSRIRREYVGLLRSGFHLLVPEERAEIFAWVSGGPERASLRALGYSDEEIDKATPTWRRDRLFWLLPHLDEGQKEEYEGLCVELGEADPRSVAPHATRSWRGPTSPLTEGDVAELSVDRLIQYLLDWRKPEGFMTHSYEGLAQQLANAVRQRPPKYISHLDRFHEVRPMYARAVLEGLSDAIESDRPTDEVGLLQPSLRLAEHLARRPAEGATATEVRWARMTVVRFLGRVLESKLRPTDQQLDLIWSILEPLLLDPDPSPTREEEQRDSGGWHQLAINTVRGRALELLRNFLVCRFVDETGHERRVGETRAWVQGQPEVLSVLERALDPSIEPSRAIRSVLGAMLGFLYLADSKWTADSIRRFFPVEPELKPLRDATWLGYVGFSDRLLPLDLVRSEYAQVLSETEASERHRDETFRLSVGLLSYYRSGALGVDDPLLIALSSSLKPNDFGRVLANAAFRLSDAPDEAAANRLQNLWDEFVHHKLAAGVSPSTLPLAAFGFWARLDAFDKEWRLSRLQRVLLHSSRIELAGDVSKALHALSDQFAGGVLTCIELLLAQAAGLGSIYEWRNGIKEIIDALRRHSDDDVARRAIDAANRMVSLGDTDFLPLAGPAE